MYSEISHLQVRAGKPTEICGVSEIQCGTKVHYFIFAQNWGQTAQIFSRRYVQIGLYLFTFEVLQANAVVVPQFRLQNPPLFSPSSAIY
jgi:hypothetical protein